MQNKKTVLLDPSEFAGLYKDAHKKPGDKIFFLKGIRKILESHKPEKIVSLDLFKAIAKDIVMENDLALRVKASEAVGCVLKKGEQSLKAQFSKAALTFLNDQQGTIPANNIVSLTLTLVQAAPGNMTRVPLELFRNVVCAEEAKKSMPHVMGSIVGLDFLLNEKAVLFNQEDANLFSEARASHKDSSIRADMRTLCAKLAKERSDITVPFASSLATVAARLRSSKDVMFRPLRPASQELGCYDRHGKPTR